MTYKEISIFPIIDSSFVTQLKDIISIFLATLIKELFLIYDYFLKY